MTYLIKYKNKVPRVHSSVYVADGVRIIGDVEVEENSSIWFNSIIRGDVNYVRIGKNRQEFQPTPLFYTENVKIGFFPFFSVFPFFIREIFFQ